MIRYSAFIFILIGLNGIFSNAGTVLTQKEKAQLVGWNRQLADKKDYEGYYPREMCGKELPTAMDENLVPPFVKAGENLGAYCREIRTKVSTICRNDEENKAKLVKNINRIQCHLGKVDETSFKIDKGVLHFTFGPKSSNLSEHFLAFFEEWEKTASK